MKAYKVKGFTPAGRAAIQLISAKADAPKAKSTLSVICDVGKKTITVEEIELPDTKKGVLELVNNLLIETLHEKK